MTIGEINMLANGFWHNLRIIKQLQPSDYSLVYMRLVGEEVRLIRCCRTCFERTPAIKLNDFDAIAGWCLAHKEKSPKCFKGKHE